MLSRNVSLLLGNLSPLASLLFIISCIMTNSVSIFQWNHCPLISTFNFICVMYSWNNNIDHNFFTSCNEIDTCQIFYDFFHQIHCRILLCFVILVTLVVCITALVHTFINHTDFLSRQHILRSAISLRQNFLQSFIQNRPKHHYAMT